MNGHALHSHAPAEAGPAVALAAPSTARGESVRVASLCLLICLAFVLAPFHPHDADFSRQTRVTGEQAVFMTSARAETELLPLFASPCCLPSRRPAPPPRPNHVLLQSPFVGSPFWLLHFREGMRHILLM